MIRLLKSIDTHFALALAVLAAFGIQHFYPQLTGEVEYFLLEPSTKSNMSDVPLLLDELGVTKKDVKHVKRTKVRDGALGNLNVSRTGIYTMDGVIRGRIPDPVQVSVDGISVSHTAFSSIINKDKNHVGISPVSQNVHLSAGNNAVAMTSLFSASKTGKIFNNRPALITIRRQVGFSLLRFTLHFALTTLMAMALSAILHQIASTTARKLSATLVLSATLIVLSTLVTYRLANKTLLPLGSNSRNMESRLAKLEDSLAKGKQQQANTSSFTVVILGDSTHAAGPKNILDNLKNDLRFASAGSIQIHGMSHRALTAREYYLLTSRIVSESPDLLVIPVNIPTFLPEWLLDERSYFSALERFVKLSEIPKILPLRTGGRSFIWEHILLHKIDYAIFEGRGGDYLNGLRRYRQNEDQRLTDNLMLRLNAGTVEEHLRTKEQEEFKQVLDVSKDHDLFPMFDLINDTARKHDIDVLYYAAPLNPDSALSGYAYYVPKVNFPFIANLISSPDHVSYLDLSDALPKSAFRDFNVHLTSEGLRTVSSLLTTEIVRLKQNKSESSANAD